MQLKRYQQNCLNILQSYFERCLIVGHEAAFEQITLENDIADRLVNIKNAYTVWNSIPNTPRVCIKVPTGGGKTIIAAYAIKTVAHTWCNKDFPLVLWFVPTDTIRRQTAEALKNHRHPYRTALDEQFEGKVKIYDLDEKFNIRPSDIEDNACIIVSTIQSFVKANTDKYNVYKDNENLEGHFAKMPPAKYMGMEIKEGKTRPQYSFSNLLHFHSPILIIDEAHKVVTELSQGTQGRLNPAAIIEFTATPKDNNNTLYNVFASELKDEEMIKLPIALTVHTNWEQAVDNAISRRAALQKDCGNEKEYIRPILLFQAQSKDKEITVEVLKKYLLETAYIPEDQIKIATGEQKELDGVDVSNPNEPTRYIITVEALKEGWDCHFAYVLCSLSNVKSDISVAQLLGRVMRMPYAKTRKTPSLNKAYAYVVSPHFSDAANALTDKLIQKGFDEDEARASIQQENQGELDPNWSLPYNSYKDEVSPADKGNKFVVPSLMFELNGQLDFADPHIIFDYYDWKLKNEAKTHLEKEDFSIEETPGQGFSIDLNGNKLQYKPTGKDHYLPYMSDIDVWQPINLIHWLDRNIRQPDITQAEMVEWLQMVIEYLIEKRKIQVPHLVIAKFALLNKLQSIIAEARRKARNKSFALFQNEYRKTIDFDNGFEFKKGMYDVIIPHPSGNYEFTKHFLGSSQIGLMNKEEAQCAQIIDSSEKVEYWLRNIDRHSASFRLPTSTDYFYPDFVAKLIDDRIFVIEYKGAHIATSQDTKDKEAIGLTWEKASNKKGLFLIVEKEKDGKTMEQQINEKINK